MIFEKLLSIPKSLYVSIRLFPFRDALKIPIIVRYNTKIVNLKGFVRVKSNVRTSMLSIGFGGVNIYDKRYSRSMLEIGGCIELFGKCSFGHGSRISVARGGVLSIGDKFSNTAEGSVVCKEQITIGNNVTTSWQTLIMDTDWHPTINTSTRKVGNPTKPITIGNNCWLGTRSVILKGTNLPDGSIVAASAVVCKKYTEENILLAGNPAQIKKNNITIYHE